MMEELLIQYGALGVCMLIFMGFFYRYYTDSKKFQDNLTQVVNNNTVALTKVYEVISLCPRAKRKV